MAEAARAVVFDAVRQAGVFSVTPQSGTASDREFGTALAAQLPALRRYAAALCGGLATGDDLVQDCIERALRQRHTLEDPARLGGWLRRILHNLHIDAIRRGRGQGTRVDLATLEDAITFSTPAADAGTARDFARAMNSLSVEHRQILLLAGAEGLSYREIAEELGVAMGTVMSRLARARALLRERMEGGGTVVRLPGMEGRRA